MKKYFAAILATLLMLAAAPSYAQQTGYAHRFYPVGNHYGVGWDLTEDAVANSLTAASIANNTIDSSQVALHLTQHVTVPLTSANILAMYATPVNLIPAGATGTNIVVHKVMFTMIPSGTAYTGGTSVEFQLGTTAHGAGTLTTGALAATVVDASGTTTTYNTLIPVAYAGTAATGLYISVTGSTFATGTGTALVDIWYSIQ